MMNWHAIKHQMTQLLPLDKRQQAAANAMSEPKQELSPMSSLLDENPGSVTLISKTDIYADSAQRVLLLRQGMEVPSDLLPKLIGCGVDPSQFILKDPIDMDQLVDRHTRDVLRTIRSQALADKQVLVLDPQQKSIQRTITVMTRVGFSLGKIHPLRMPQYLNWSIEKYQPSILVMDYDLGEGKSALSFLYQLQTESPELLEGLERIVMTMPVGVIPDDAYDGFLATVEALNVDVWFKPVMAKSLESLLQIDVLMPIDTVDIAQAS